MNEPAETAEPYLISVDDEGLFSYRINSFELKNALGNLIATLQEYQVEKNEGKHSTTFCKLYKTKEGNWYDLDDNLSPSKNNLIRILKSAIDQKEKEEN